MNLNKDNLYNLISTLNKTRMKDLIYFLESNLSCLDCPIYCHFIDEKDEESIPCDMDECAYNIQKYLCQEKKESQTFSF